MDKGTIIAMFIWLIAVLLLFTVHIGEDDDDLD